METPLARRKSYRTSFRSADYFIVRAIDRFARRQLAGRLRAGLDVLDVGCGEQPLRDAVTATGARYVSADIAQNSAGTVDHLCAVTALPVADGSLDCVLLTEVLEHVSETRPAFRELARVLRPGGIVILTTPLLYPLHEEPHDFVRLTPFQIERCATEAGFEILEMEKAGNEFEVLASFYGRCWVWLYDAVGNAAVRRWCAIAIGLTQAVVNALAIAAGRMLPLEQHRRVFLNSMCVLRRR